MEAVTWESELARAHQCLAAARILADNNLHADSVSRSYYAAFHAAVALIASVGRTARTHEGVRALIWQHFVKAGALAPELGHVLSEMSAHRAEADYNTVSEFTEREARGDIDRAARFIAAIEPLLTA